MRDSADRDGLATWSSRDFDYGVGDDLDSAVRQVCRRIADQIRSAAPSPPRAAQAEQLAYEQAARIAEQGWSRF